MAALKEKAEEVDNLIQKIQGLQELFRCQFGNQQTTQAGAGDRRYYSCGQLGHFAASCRRNAMHKQQRRTIDNWYVNQDYFHGLSTSGSATEEVSRNDVASSVTFARRQVISSTHATSRSASRWTVQQKRSPMTATGRASPRRTLSRFGLAVAHLVLL